MTTQPTITRHAPGKLFVTGEYAVIEPGHPAVLVAVDRLVSVTASAPEADGDGVAVSSDLHPHRVRLRWQGPHLAGRTAADQRAAGSRLQPVVAALEVVAELLAERGSPAPAFTLSIDSQLHDSGTKLGLGSSGAVTVAVIAAAAAYAGVDLASDARFRLAMIAAARLDVRSSGADLAASTWRGWIVYQAPDRAAVLDMVRRHGIGAALQATWPGFAVRRLTVPGELALQVGWTGSPASTQELVAAGTQTWRGSPVHRAFLAAMTESVQATVSALEQRDCDSVLQQIRSARELLAGFDKDAGVGIFTDKLTALCDAADAAGWAAKPSGAGGGDCGIALRDAPAGPDIDLLRERWAAAGIRQLPVQVLGDETDAQ